MMPGEVIAIRRAQLRDAAAVAAIYGHAVLHGTGTFDIEAPGEAGMAARIAELGEAGWPFLVAERMGLVCGFAYAAPFRARAAFRTTLEDSIYVAPDAQGLGAGRALLSEVLAAAERAGCRQMLALIGDSANAASIGLHRKLGFAEVGVMTSVGFKHGRWLDVMVMQRSLGAGDTSRPA